MRSKRNIGSIVILFGIAIPLVGFLYSCKKTAEKYSDQINVIYEAPGLKTGVNPSIFADHVTLVEEIGYNNSSLDSFRCNQLWLTLYSTYSSNLDLNNIKRVSYDWGPMKAILIPLDEGNESEYLIAYTYDDKFLFVKYICNALPNGNRLFQFTSVDGLEYFSFELNSENKIGNRTVSNSIPWLTTFYPSITERIVTPPGGGQLLPCNQQGLSYGDCMECAINECMADWICACVCMIEPAPCIAGFALGCLYTWWS